MADELLNGREPTDWELAAIEKGRKCALARDAQVVKGLTAEYPREEGTGRPRPVADITWKLP